MKLSLCHSLVRSVIISAFTEAKIEAEKLTTGFSQRPTGQKRFVMHEKNAALNFCFKLYLMPVIFIGDIYHKSFIYVFVLLHR